MRRFFFAAVVLLVALSLGSHQFLLPSAAAQSKAVAVSTQAPVVTIEQVNRWETELSNWGRWGKDDERGSLNLITPQKEVQAARLVKDGVTVTLAHFADLEKAADNFNFGPTRHEMFKDPQTGRVRGALDIISFGIHDGTNSHLDALCHYALRRDGQILVFNGHPQDLDEAGCKANGMDRMGPGIFTRGILVDLPLLKGVPYLEPGTPIYASDLEAWEKYAGVKISSGDALFVRTGRWARRAKLGPWNAGREAAGLHASVMPWLKQRDIALLGGDGVNDVQPSGVVGTGEAAGRPVHTLAIAVMGVPLVDNAYLEDVAKEAAVRKRWEFLTTVQFMRIP
ncbi:MAG TPA: cyclase family protein, partial [Bryobacteraceae bacterium]|nr:cyclase family protein [Bryobacteraceae bacterium]